MVHESILPREGDLYKVYQIDRHIFEIRYGYYADDERGRVEPLPVFPDLRTQPVYTAAGHPIVTLVQQPCDRYRPKNPLRREDWCGDCHHYSGGRDELGICLCLQENQA